jgi:hypothetical protein
VEIDERHRAGECRDPIRDPILHALRSLFGVLAQGGVRRWRKVRQALVKVSLHG